ncbi:MAG: hypothetical protein PHC30_00470, partial [Lentisphaeria bacterium]|nr:hypothetical protein [Lentisphaeria bacterium]
GQEGLELLSAGNKLIALTPDLSDFRLELSFRVDIALSGQMALLVSFRYDLATRTGDALRCQRPRGSQQLVLEYGRMADNRFEPVQSATLETDDQVFAADVSMTMVLTGTALNVEVAAGRVAFTTAPPRFGKVAISRGHFFAPLLLTAFALTGDEQPVPAATGQCQVTLPGAATLYPIRCRVDWRDYGDVCEADLVFSGGVPETPAGEGNYHGMRADILDRPYFKVIQADVDEKQVLVDGQVVLVVEQLAPAYFYQVLHRRTPWPLRRTVRFAKPKGPFCLAVGAESYLHTTTKTLALRPAETWFSLDGTCLHSGLGLSTAPYLVTFASQADKAILARLPADDPRREAAAEFARRNHYFLAGEPLRLTITVLGGGALPSAYAVELEDAFLAPLRPLAVRMAADVVPVGPRSMARATLVCEVLADLAPGVYHLRVRGCDSSVPPLEEYCALEVLSREPGAPPPPILSGLPYLYDSRTETRGLATDSFDPWLATAVDEGHYMAAVNFLPKCARDNAIAPTVRAYGREWFLWLNSRCADRPRPEDNLDLVAEADYITPPTDLLGLNSLLWIHQYRGEILDWAIDFMNDTGDQRFDLEAARGARAAGGQIDLANAETLAEYHWAAWTDFAQERMAARRQAVLDKLRQVNPRLRFAGYGPAPIYASHYKGQEFVATLLNARDDLGRRGFWQYEDYPSACSYGIERGTYFLTASLMALPGHRIYPEIYTLGIQGCPDGAVFFAHPPYGRRLANPPLRIKRRVYDYAFASAHWLNGAFHYWDQGGFQVCGFDRERYEVLLRAWRNVRLFPPARPLRSAAFVYDDGSWRRDIGQTLLTNYGGAILDVRKTVAEDVPFACEMARRQAVLAGFQVNAGELAGLTPADVDLLVLPPLAGMAPASLEAIRRLHAGGVNLLGFEDVSGLEDLFGVRDTGASQAVTHLRGTSAFLPGQTEFCEEPRCRGKYAAAGAAVLLEAEVPVLLQQRNAAATAALFNVPPTLVRDDQLHDRLGYGRESISALVNQAAGLVISRLSGQAATASAGRLLGFRTHGGETVLVVANPGEQGFLVVEVRLSKTSVGQCLVSCDQPFTVLNDEAGAITVRLRLPAEESALLVFRDGPVTER